MKTAFILWCCLTALCALPCIVLGSSLIPSIADPGRVFEAARVAYDGGRYDEAAGLYRQLLEAGYGERAVLFNLGNAEFRAGHLGEAVLNYRRAWYRAPRDEDIRTNLGFALEHTGAQPPRATPAARFLRRLSFSGWAALATLAWWLLAGLTLAAVAGTRYRALLGRLGVLSALVLLISLAGMWQWHRLVTSAEQVVVSPGQAARYAPLAEADTHFDLPAGSIVTRLETSGDWLRVGQGGQKGWVPAEACRSVLADKRGGP
jgi:tetratricopeptide (TPR) repeat protein